MRTVIRAALFAGAAVLIAPGAIASSTFPSSDCETEGDCSNPQPPTKDNLPFLAIDPGAHYFAYPSDGVNTAVVEGETYYNTHANQTYIAGFGQGAGVPFDNSVFTYGGPNSLATVQAYFSPNPTASATAHQSDYSGRVTAVAGITYLVTLSAPDSATANAVSSLLQSGALATVQGSYTLTASGYAKSYAVAESQWGPDGATDYSFSSMCDGTTNDGCATSSFGFNLGFRRGTDFADGRANDFYAEITLSSEADAGSGAQGLYFGDSSALVDPTITLISQLQNYNLTLSVGSFGPGGIASPLPEPASWGMMVMGFGLIGAAARRRHRQAATA